MKTNYIILLISCLCFYTSISNAQDVTLYTPRGSVVYGFFRSEYTLAEITLHTNRARNSYPKATVLANASRTYNCHSYAWNLTSGGSTYCWVNQTENGQGIANYWNDNSHGVSSEAMAENIFYYEGDHSAVRSSVAGKYESKWGEGPLMRHDPGYGPANYKMNKRRYYVRNVKVSGNTLVSSTGSTVTISNPGTFRTSTVWNYSSNLQLVNSSNTSAVFKSTTNSAGWVRAGFNGYTTKDFAVWAGKPVITSVEGERRIPNGQYARFEAKYNYSSSPTRFQWILNPSSGGNVYGANTASVDIAFYNEGTYQLVVRATNANGTGEYFVTGCNVYNASSYSYQVYPSPASTILIVSFNQKPNEESLFDLTKNNLTKSFKIYLYNESGSIVRKTTSDGSQIQFDVANLPDGMYYLRIDDGNGEKPEMQKVIVKH